MSGLQDISQHFLDRISSIQTMLDLSATEVPHNKIQKLGQELFVLQSILEKFEKCVDRQKNHLKQLQELDELFQKNVEDVQHLKENPPAHMPRKKSPSGEKAAVKHNEAADVRAQTETIKKSSRSSVREMEVVTVSEFENIPQYMKGRVSYDQLNAAVHNINSAVAAKYKILHQSSKTLNNHTRKLQQRFKEQETKDTKGRHFVVDEDFREFTQTKMDKRFQGILNMLRHCQRLRELRGGGTTRYVLL